MAERLAVPGVLPLVIDVRRRYRTVTVMLQRIGRSIQG
jgi:hypothetical protein